MACDGLKGERQRFTVLSWGAWRLHARENVKGGGSFAVGCRWRERPPVCSIAIRLWRATICTSVSSEVTADGCWIDV